jgi:hypothetical protein
MRNAVVVGIVVCIAILAALVVPGSSSLARMGEPEPLGIDPGCIRESCRYWCSGPFDSGSFTGTVIGVFEHYDEYGNPHSLSAFVHAECTATCVHLWYVKRTCTISHNRSGYGRLTLRASCKTAAHPWCAASANTIKWCEVDLYACSCY